MVFSCDALDYPHKTLDHPPQALLVLQFDTNLRENKWIQYTNATDEIKR